MPNKHEAESNAAADFAVEQGFPALIGSPKQIAWAETIRAEAAKSLFEIRLQLKSNTEVNGDDSIFRVIDAILLRTSAKDWIDSRSNKGYGKPWFIAQIREAMDKIL